MSGTTRTHAYSLGFIDGYNNPYDLTSGITWDETVPDHEALNESYDEGATDGQALRQFHDRMRGFPTPGGI